MQDFRYSRSICASNNTKAIRVNRYSSVVTSYFVFQIKTLPDLPYAFRHSKLDVRTWHVNDPPALHCCVRAEIHAGEHDRLIIQHNLDARVKHHFRLRKGTDRETIAGGACNLATKEARAPRSYLNLFWAAIVRPIRSKPQEGLWRYSRRFSRRFVPRIARLALRYIYSENAEALSPPPS